MIIHWPSKPTVLDPACSHTLLKAAARIFASATVTLAQIHQEPPPMTPVSDHEPPPELIEQARAFVARKQWIFAKTMPRTRIATWCCSTSERRKIARAIQP